MCIPFSEGYILRLSLYYLPIFNICNRFLSIISHVNFNYGFQFGVFCSFSHFIYPPFISIILKVIAYSNSVLYVKIFFINLSVQIHHICFTLHYLSGLFQFLIINFKMTKEESFTNI